MARNPVTDPITVLIVDDDAEMRAVIKNFLEQDGYRVIERGRARDALLALDDALQPDVVIVDRVMPDMSGTELLSLLRRRFDIPVILITAFGGPDVEVDALRRGAASYLEKPFRMSAVAQAVARLTRGPHVGGQAPPAGPPQ